MTPPTTQTGMEKRLKEYECIGRNCNHEISEEHYIVDKAFIRSEITKAVEAERERIRKALPEQVGNIKNTKGVYKTYFWVDDVMKAIDALKG